MLRFALLIRWTVYRPDSYKCFRSALSLRRIYLSGSIGTLSGFLSWFNLDTSEGNDQILAVNTNSFSFSAQCCWNSLQQTDNPVPNEAIAALRSHFMGLYCTKRDVIKCDLVLCIAHNLLGTRFRLCTNRPGIYCRSSYANFCSKSHIYQLAMAIKIKRAKLVLDSRYVPLLWTFFDQHVWRCGRR